MSDIFHDFPIRAPQKDVFEAVSTATGLDAWWSNQSTGNASIGSEFQLQFGPEYEWRAVVTKYVPNSEFEIEMTVSDDDWNGTRIGFHLTETNDVTLVRFHHMNWPEANEHYRRSSFCWAMYLVRLKRYVENSDVVPYSDRFNV